MEKEQVFQKPSVLIAGYGIVGKNLKQIFDWADVYDKYKDEYKTKKDYYDFCFISVPTPKTESWEADISSVLDVIENVNADYYIVKSTIPPTTTEMLIEKYNKKIIFSPEYQGNTQHANLDYDFVILGGNKEYTEKVAQLYQYAYTADLKVYQTDSRTAELCKYMENSYLACKVVFCNEFFRIAKKLNINYNELRELFVADPRFNKSHTFVYEKYPFYDSKCFNKDLPALVYQMKQLGYDAQFVNSIININEGFKNGI